jgi:hypothetical protein
MTASLARGGTTGGEEQEVSSRQSMKNRTGGYGFFMEVLVLADFE